jgi:Fe-S-cluster containining protein
VIDESDEALAPHGLTGRQRLNNSFQCVGCGRCCHGLRLPLSCTEALAWLNRGGEVEVFVDAIPWPSEPQGNAGQATYRRDRTFPAMSGYLPIRVSVSLMASFEAACPNLASDNRCGIYTERPLACRIYPAEVNPFIPMRADGKRCPEEAWQGHNTFPDGITRQAIDRMRAITEDETSRREGVARMLGLAKAALANQGSVVATPDRTQLIRALEEACGGHERAAGHATQWTLVSDHAPTLNTLMACDAVASLPAADPASRYLSYLG